MFPINLIGARIAWRELDLPDAEALVEILGHPAVVPYTVDEEPPGLDVMRTFLDSYGEAREQPDRTEYKLVIVLGDRVIGTGGLSLHKGPHRCGEIGYLLHPDHWGRGLATEAADLLLSFGFDDLALHRIEASTIPTNHASCRVLEKLGMSREGLHRHDSFRRGKWRDSARYAILETDPRLYKAGSAVPG